MPAFVSTETPIKTMRHLRPVNHPNGIGNFFEMSKEKEIYVWVYYG
jgi:hypothetical protein